MKSILILMAICLSVKSFSQNFTVKYSEEFKVVEKMYKEKIIKNSIYQNGFIYSAVNNKSAGLGKWLFTRTYDLKLPLQVRKYDINMKEVKEFKLEGGDRKFAMAEPLFIQLRDRLLLGYYKPYKKQSFDFYLASVDEETLHVTEGTKLFSIPVENVGIFKIEDELDKITAVRFAVSPDETRLMVAMMKDASTVSLRIVNGDLKVEKQYDTRLSGNTGMALVSGLLTNDNTIYCSFSTGLGDSRVLIIDSAGKKRELKSASFIPGKYVYRLFFQPAKDNNTVYFYSTFSSVKGDHTYCNGFFVAGYDINSQQLSKPAVYEFGTDFTKAVAEKGTGGGAPNGNNIVDFVPVLTQLENGELALSGSPETFSQVVSQSMNKTTVWSTTQVGSVFSFFLNRELAVQSYAILPRKIVLSLPESRSGSVQIMQGARISTAFAGIYVVPKGEALVVVYSDYEKNISQDLDKPAYSSNTPNNLVLAEAELLKNGQIAFRKQITEDQKGMYTFYLSEALFNTSNNSLLVPIGKQGLDFNANKEFYNKWCILEPVR